MDFFLLNLEDAATISRKLLHGNGCCACMIIFTIRREKVVHLCNSFAFHERSKARVGATKLRGMKQREAIERRGLSGETGNGKRKLRKRQEKVKLCRLAPSCRRDFRTRIAARIPFWVILCDIPYGERYNMIQMRPSEKRFYALSEWSKMD